MIVDHIRNREKYYFLGEAYKTALEYMARVTEENFPAERVYFDDENLLIIPLKTTTKPAEEGKFEAHRKKADIHFVISGAEKIGYKDIALLTPIDEFNEESDCGFYDGSVADYVTLLPGYFAIVLADDAHIPCICVDKPQELTKLIGKINL